MENVMVVQQLILQKDCCYIGESNYGMENVMIVQQLRYALLKE